MSSSYRPFRLRVGKLSLLGAAIEERTSDEDRVVLDGAVYYRAGKSVGEDDEFVRPGAL